VRLSAALAVAWLSLCLAGCAESGVVRVFDGREVLGPYISETAYSAYAEAAERTARGEVQGAIRALQRAAQEDPRSPQIWTALGAARLPARGGGARAAPRRGRLPAGRGDRPRLRAALARARALPPPTASRMPTCARGPREAARELAALEASAKAVALDPDDVEAVAVRATLLLRARRGDEARL
jgi:tetratricopeptide (TPR) repeat protein